MTDVTLPGQPIAHGRLANDHPLGRPTSMTDEECGTLHVRQKIYEPTPGRPYPELLSRWTPTPGQRALIAAGHDLYLSCVGGQPPVLVYAGDPDGLDQVAPQPFDDDPMPAELQYEDTSVDHLKPREAWGDIECSGCTLPRRDCECN